MRKIKIIALLMSLTSCLFLCGVGFSIWYNVKPIEAKYATGSIQTAYDVLKISNTEMTIFKFSMLSFKTGDAQTADFRNSDVGTITVTHTVGAAALEATGGNFRVDLALGYDETTLYNDYNELFGALSVGEGDNTISVKCEAKNANGALVSAGELAPVDAEDTTAAHKLSASELKSAYEFRDVVANNEGSYSFTVTYTFRIPGANDNFRQNFGQYLMGADTQGKTVTKFVTSAYISKLS